MAEKVAIYCRLSEEDKNKKNQYDDSESIQNQKTMLVKYAFERGWEIYNIYSDDDYAGSDRSRPQFNQLLQDAEHKKFNIILCKTQSRFTRELELVEKYIHGLFLLWDIRFIGVVDNADTANKGNKKSRQITGLTNEWYLEDLSDSIKGVFDMKRSEGIHIGSFALYGYKKDPEQKGHLIIDEPAAQIVREVFQMFAAGMGKTAIARELNRRKIPNPTEYKRLQGLRYKGLEGKNSTLWAYYAISDMLRNEMYIGNMVQGKYGTVSYKIRKNKPKPVDEWFIKENTHEPIIEKELWDKVQTLLQLKAKPFKVGEVGIFARKVKCAHCGYIMRSKIKGKHRYLACSSRYKSEDACIGSFIPQEYLHDYVLNEFQKMIALYLDTDKAEQLIELSGSPEKELQALKKEMALYNKKKDECQKAIKELYRDKITGSITLDDFQSLSREFKKDSESYQCLINETEKKIEKRLEEEKEVETKRDLLEKYTGIKQLNYDIINLFINHIEIGHRASKAEEYPIKIFWEF